MANSPSVRFATLTLSALLSLGTLAIAACTAFEETVDTNVDGEIVTLYVGPEVVDCVGVGPQDCLQVRYDPDDEYELFYSSIDGFAYEPGYNYELQVQKAAIENPPADGSSIQWTLIEVVSQTPAATSR